MVPAFAGVCLVLAIIPCACSLYWLGDDVFFFVLPGIMRQVHDGIDAFHSQEPDHFSNVEPNG